MRLTRSHVALPLHCDQEVALPEESANHLLRVLRLRQGDACILFNGDGSDYHARITVAGKRDARALVERVEPLSNESPLRITLMQGIARGEKMDLILQKATELGVAAIVPVIAERTEVKLDAARTEKNAWRTGAAWWSRLASNPGVHVFPAWPRRWVCRTRRRPATRTRYG